MKVKVAHTGKVAQFAEFSLRLFMGFIFLIFGLNGFFQFFPMPRMSLEGFNFIIALAETGYLFPFILLIQIGCGATLITNKYVPLSLLIIFPIALNIFLFHLFLDNNGLVLGSILILSNLGLGWMHRDDYMCLFDNPNN